MSRRETRSTAAAAAVAVAGDNSEDGSNNKRKRDDDNENDLLEDDDGRNNNNGAAEPEAVLSLDQGSDDEDDIDIDVPDGEFPSAFQLGRMLTLVEAVPAGKFDKESYDRMEMLGKWTSYSENKENPEEWVRCKVDLQQLGGLLRMTYLIERHMKDSTVVQAASKISANLMYFCNLLDDDKKRQLNAAATYAIQAGTLRILLLASEEFIPSKNHENWVAARSIWRAVHNTCNRASELIDQSSLQPIVEANIIQYCLSDPTRSADSKVSVGCCVATVTEMALKAHPLLAPLIHQHGIMESAHEFCKTHCSHILSSPIHTKQILGFCNFTLKSGLMSSGDMKKWLPFMSEAISMYLTNHNKGIEKMAYKFVERAVDNINHRELDDTPFVKTLFSISQSSDTPEELKTKYRALMTKILS
mmetsp:Transcript_62203/g.151681  ORF Transcript_62203/g.151681 Transcript_62203/m.151681 type:complete len:416 (+) Transcript_62203:104-1351(+)